MTLRLLKSLEILLSVHVYPTCGWHFILGICLSIVHSSQLDWSHDKKRLLEFREKPQDIKTAKQMIESHKVLWEDVNSYKDRYS